MPQRLTKLVKEERRIILENRLHDTRLTRSLGFGVDRADIMCAIGHGRYTDQAYNISEIAALTGMNRHRISRHLGDLHEAGLILEIQSGNDRLQTIPDNALWLPFVVEYFEERKKALLHTATMLTSSIDEHAPRYMG